jgi:hypothetical protein
MTLMLMHENENVGQWPNDLIDEAAEKLKESISKPNEKIDTNEVLSIIAEFLPDPIRDAIS